jgi:hypothetical protein
MAGLAYSERLRTALQGWDGVEILQRRLGAMEFRVHQRVFGHLHPNGRLDLPCSVRMRRELVAAGIAESHDTMARTGWVTVRIRSEHDIPRAVTLLRANYGRLRGVEFHLPVLPFSGAPTLLSPRADDDLPA